MQSKSYKTIKNTVENTTVIERSKFICYMKGVDNEDDAKEFIGLIRKQNSLATHNCYAYVADEFGLIQKFSDDGEPQGTTGLPMLEALKSSGLSKVVCVVTRYFGGVKLGTGGLVRAYGGAVLECIKNSKIINVFMSKIVEITSDYDNYSKLLKLLSNENYSILETNFSDKIVLRVAIKEESFVDFVEKIQDLYKGKQLIRESGEKYVSFGDV